ncbi:PAX-interacting protein 1-like [Pollicipes pollicipes]|uniref:PAX-interacting protein 1-like n=1 Tax=Pollicipes pollicipes TaxID=41117 RepID=UPI0018852526|nr:PAX-interacting protein 1-like [Pollicipes pollicipes]
MAQIFSSIRYFTTGRLSPKVEEQLENGGAKRETYFTDYTTHLIVGELPDEDVINEAHDLYERPALRAVWVTLSAAAGKLLPTAAFSHAPGQVFRGVRVCCSRLEPDDVRTVWALVTFHGGAFQRRLDARCTHLVVGKPEGAMYERCLQPAGPVPVTPDWEEDRRPSGEQEKQQLLARLKQNLPWNQPDKVETGEARTRGQGALVWWREMGLGWCGTGSGHRYSRRSSVLSSSSST